MIARLCIYLVAGLCGLSVSSGSYGEAAFCALMALLLMAEMIIEETGK